MDTKEIVIRLYSETDKDVVEWVIKSMGIGAERYSFDTYHKDYCYNEVFLKVTDDELKSLRFRLGLHMPMVYEFG